MTQALSLADLQYGVDGADMAGAWSVKKVEEDRFGWSAWSDFVRAHHGGQPEVQGFAPNADEAREAAVAAARSMNPAGCVRVLR